MRGAESLSACSIKGDCTGDLHERNWVVLQWLHTTEHCSGSVLEAGRCLSSPSLARKAWKIPGKMLAFSPHWKPKLEAAAIGKDRFAHSGKSSRCFRHISVSGITMEGASHTARVFFQLTLLEMSSQTYPRGFTLLVLDNRD